MRFENPEYLVPLLIFFFALGIWAKRKRQYVTVASLEQVRRSSVVSRTVVRLPHFCWLALAFLLLAAFANPQSSKMTSHATVLTKNAIVCVDASQSMGAGKRFSTMEMIRAMLHDFADRRIEKGDYMGISAYSGFSENSRAPGYARVIQYPTRDSEVIHAAIDAIRPMMFGAFTAIGDGLLVSITALIEPEAREALGDKYDRQRLADSLWSIGTEGEDVEYAQEIIRAVGRQKGRYIVLFTDGKFNTGMHPAKALWFAERLGLKVHFIAFESTGATGLSFEEERKRKAETIEAVVQTGGLYRESTDIRGVEQLFKEIDEAEKTEIIVKDEPIRESRRKVFTFGAAAAYALWVLSWIVWGDPL